MSKDAETNLYLFNESTALNIQTGFLPNAKETKVYGQPITIWNNRTVHLNGDTLKEMREYVNGFTKLQGT